MAYTVDQSSGTGLQGAWDDIYYVVRDTTNYNAPKFRYILKVTITIAQYLILVVLYHLTYTKTKT